MKEKIISILNEVYKELSNEADNLKKPFFKTIDITYIKPYELHQFMVDNNIPTDACFKGSKYECSLSWLDHDRPYTKKEKTKFIISLFEYRCEDKIIELLAENDYKFRTCHSLSYPYDQLNDSGNFYRAYIDGKSDMIVDYYLEYYEKNYKDKDKLPSNAEELIKEEFSRIADKMYYHNPNWSKAECTKLKFTNPFEIESIVADKFRYNNYYTEITADKHIIVSWGYKRGTEVVVKSEKWYNNNKNCADYIRGNEFSNNLFTSNMVKYTNQKAIITDICDGYYKIDLDNGENKWESWMFED